MQRTKLFQKPTLKSSTNKLSSYLPNSVQPIFNYLSSWMQTDNTVNEETKLHCGKALSKFCKVYAPAIEMVQEEYSESMLWDAINKFGSGVASQAGSVWKLLFVLIPGAAGAIQVKSGVPNGAESFCQGVKVSCIEGYLYDDTVNKVLTHFVRDITVNDPDNGPNLLTLNQCLSVENVGSAISSMFQTGTQTCSATNNPVPGSTITVQATNLGLQCSSFQSNFQKVFASCNSEASQTGLIIGMATLGGVLLLALLAGVGIYCCKRNNQRP